MATRQTEKQKRTGKKTRTDRGKRAVEDMDPGLGVVWWAVMAGERMVWSSRCWRVSHLREAILLSFPVGRSLKEETSSRRERETDKRIGSEGKCGR